MMSRMPSCSNVASGIGQVATEAGRGAARLTRGPGQDLGKSRRPNKTFVLDPSSLGKDSKSRIDDSRVFPLHVFFKTSAFAPQAQSTLDNTHNFYHSGIALLVSCRSSSNNRIWAPLPVTLQPQQHLGIGRLVPVFLSHASIPFWRTPTTPLYTRLSSWRLLRSSPAPSFALC
jgi:hypothetical protein